MQTAHPVVPGLQKVYMCHLCEVSLSTWLRYTRHSLMSMKSGKWKENVNQRCGQLLPLPSSDVV